MAASRAPHATRHCGTFSALHNFAPAFRSHVPLFYFGNEKKKLRFVVTQVAAAIDPRALFSLAVFFFFIQQLRVHRKSFMRWLVGCLLFIRVFAWGQDAKSSTLALCRDERHFGARRELWELAWCARWVASFHERDLTYDRLLRAPYWGSSRAAIVHIVRAPLAADIPTVRK